MADGKDQQCAKQVGQHAPCRKEATAPTVANPGERGPQHRGRDAQALQHQQQRAGTIDQRISPFMGTSSWRAAASMRAARDQTCSSRRFSSQAAPMINGICAPAR